MKLVACQNDTVPHTHDLDWALKMGEWRAKSPSSRHPNEVLNGSKKLTESQHQSSHTVPGNITEKQSTDFRTGIAELLDRPKNPVPAAEICNVRRCVLSSYRLGVKARGQGRYVGSKICTCRPDPSKNTKQLNSDTFSVAIARVSHMWSEGIRLSRILDTRSRPKPM